MQYCPAPYLGDVDVLPGLYTDCQMNQPMHIAVFLLMPLRYE